VSVPEFLAPGTKMARTSQGLLNAEEQQLENEVNRLLGLISQNNFFIIKLNKCFLFIRATLVLSQSTVTS
jgi:hypothetical protein